MKPKTLRDEFAMAALQAVIMRCDTGQDIFLETISWEYVADKAYDVADAMLESRQYPEVVDGDVVLKG